MYTERHRVFVVAFPETASISGGVVRYFSRRYKCDLAARRNEIWAHGEVDPEVMRHYIETEALIYRRRDGKICLRAGRKV